MLKEKLQFVLINTLLLYIPLLALTDPKTDRRRNEYTCCTWAGGIVFSSCVVVSVIWFWWEIVFGVTYLLVPLC
jgi:hypothetical protein